MDMTQLPTVAEMAAALAAKGAEVDRLLLLNADIGLRLESARKALAEAQAENVSLAARGDEFETAWIAARDEAALRRDTLHRSRCEATLLRLSLTALAVRLGELEADRQSREFTSA